LEDVVIDGKMTDGESKKEGDRENNESRKVQVTLMLLLHGGRRLP